MSSLRGMHALAQRAARTDGGPGLFGRGQSATHREGGHYGALTGDAQAAIHQTLENHFGHALMGRMRRGDEVISPEDQAYIRKVFTQFGQGVEPVFKSFEAHYVKPPRRK